jgi:lipopolysaccharide transport system permease protein
VKEARKKIVIEPNKSVKDYWLDFWRFRELLYMLSWRDLKVRYRQTMLGVAWAVLRPLLTMIILTLVFSRWAGLRPPEGVPYPIFVFAAMLPWQFFANALTDSSGSLIANERMVTKVYFPRMIVPLSSVFTAMVDFAINLVLLFGLMAFYQFVPSWNVIFIPIFGFWAFLVAVGSGLFFSSLNIQFRDFRQIVPFIVQFGLYLSPVGYPTTKVSEAMRPFFALNPMVGVIDSFRWAVIGGEKFPLQPYCLISFGVTLVILSMGILVFRRMERSFADII